MSSIDIANRLRAELESNLRHNILPYWMERMTDPRGGFYGRRDGNDNLDADAPKGAILNGRLLWTFSAAYRKLGEPACLEAATRAYEYLRDRFVDRVNGGVYWSVTAEGEPLDTHKQFYALGFAIYGFSEYARATGSAEALELAKELFHCIEEHSRDRVRGGYIEALTADWQPLADMRLSEKDANEAKTMNTHLHIIEPYTNLYRIWPDAALREAIVELMHIFLDVMEDPATHHLGLFFTEEWERRDGNISYGHDIEASWLLMETALVLGDPELLRKTEAHTRAIANAALEGRSDSGWMAYERFADGHLDADRHWWVQAEDVIGLVYLHCFHHVDLALEKAWLSWRYIKENLVDNEGGEWLWSRRADEAPNRTDDKAGFWKCPYHNSRMCLEVMERLEECR